MKKYKVWYGLGGGFGGARDFEIIEEENEYKASEYAWELACQVYESYAGLHGLRDYDQIAEDEGLDVEQDEEEINEIFDSERESWLDYWVEEYNKNVFNVEELE